MLSEGSKDIYPASLRNETGSFELFKNHLDAFLSGVPDQPTVPGQARAAATNSLLDQLLLLPLE